LTNVENITFIHPTAIIGPDVQIGKGAYIGPYCVVDGKVKIGDSVRLISHVSVAGNTTIGEGTEIFPFASIGHIPQDLKFSGEESELIIGKFNKIREHVTMNPGTQGGGLKTIIGDHCLFMMASHVAHDCIIGNNVILANNATLAGHVTVGDHVVMGGLSAVHQFVRIGEHAMIGGMSGVESDVIPYGLVMGERARLAGLNLVGLERRGFEKTSINHLRNAYQEIFTSQEGTMSERITRVIDSHQDEPLIDALVDFIQTKESRSLCQPRSSQAA
jgi:UDP-N-acetylglucosamine acyltransferase